MNEYTDFDILQTGELAVLRKGLFKPVFEFTDGQFIYGKLITNNGKKPVLETAKESWILRREGRLFKKTLLISNAAGSSIGLVNDGDRFLRLNNGFEATLALIGGGRTVVSGSWKNAEFGDLISFKQSFTSYKKPYKITFDKGFLKHTNEIPLLTLLGTYIAFLKQTRSFR